MEKNIIFEFPTSNLSKRDSKYILDLKKKENNAR